MMINNALHKIQGNIIPIPGMYELDRTISLDAYRRFLEKKVAEGNMVFYLAHSASEFKYMSASERLKITKTVCEAVDLSDTTVLCQPVGSGSIQSQLEEGMQMQDLGASALVILPGKPVMSGKFFSCHYDKSGFNKTVHGDYYVDYMGDYARKIDVPLVFHDAPLSNNQGLPLGYLDQVLNIDGVQGIKVHSPDPCAMHTIYDRYSDTHFSFDGFGKTMQFWSILWGASARHTCWSWFDSRADQEFYESLKNNETSIAVNIINKEWELAKQIKKNGFAGYKELMRINGLLDNNLTRVPGLSMSAEECRLLLHAYDSYRKTSDY